MNADRHVTDGDLIGLLDGEPIADQQAMEAHVDTCAVCTSRLAQLQQRSSHFSQVLRAIDVPSVNSARLRPAQRDIRGRRPGRAWSHPGLRAAAGLVLLAGIAAASPVRAWIVDRVTRGRPVETPIERRPVPRRSAPDAEQVVGSVVRFAPENDQLLVRLATRPAGGTLTVVGGTDSLSSAQITSAAHGEAFLVLPGELRIRNEPGSRADYQLVVSPAIGHIQLQVGDEPRAMSIVRPPPGARRSIALDGRGNGR
jgi:hypothetical protein